MSQNIPTQKILNFKPKNSFSPPRHLEPRVPPGSYILPDTVDHVACLYYHLKIFWTTIAFQFSLFRVLFFKEYNGQSEEDSLRDGPLVF